MRSLETLLICLMLWFQHTFLNQEITLTCEQTLNRNESQVFFHGQYWLLKYDSFSFHAGKEWKFEEMVNS